jgi:hypothetical protein
MMTWWEWFWTVLGVLILLQMVVYGIVNPLKQLWSCQ